VEWLEAVKMDCCKPEKQTDENNKNGWWLIGVIAVILVGIIFIKFIL